MMKERTWQSELERFRLMPLLGQLEWLSELVFLISIFARGTYEPGSDNVANPNELRRFNELIHRVAGFQKKIAAQDSGGIPDNLFFELLERSLNTLDVDIDYLWSHLP